jgi:hypothetical protein
MGNIIKILSHEIRDVILPDKEREWTGIIFHHTAITTMQEDQGEYIEDLHLNGKREGYPPFKNGMGYHFLINGSGSIQIGIRWPRQIPGAHCIGYNRKYIGVACAGDFEHQTVTGRQLTSLLSLIRNLKYSTGTIHSLLAPTKCPGRYFPIKDVHACLNFMKLKTEKRF